MPDIQFIDNYSVEEDRANDELVVSHDNGEEWRFDAIGGLKASSIEVSEFKNSTDVIGQDELDHSVERVWTGNQQIRKTTPKLSLTRDGETDYSYITFDEVDGTQNFRIQHNNSHLAIKDQEAGGRPLIINPWGGPIEVNNSNLQIDTNQSIIDENNVERLSIGWSNTILRDEDGNTRFAAVGGGATQIRTDPSGGGIRLLDEEGSFTAAEYNPSASSPGTLELTNSNLHLSGNKLGDAKMVSSNEDLLELEQGDTAILTEDPGSALHFTNGELADYITIIGNGYGWHHTNENSIDIDGTDGVTWVNVKMGNSTDSVGAYFRENTNNHRFIGCKFYTGDWGSGAYPLRIYGSGMYISHCMFGNLSSGSGYSIDFRDTVTDAVAIGNQLVVDHPLRVRTANEEVDLFGNREVVPKSTEI